MTQSPWGMPKAMGTPIMGRGAQKAAGLHPIWEHWVRKAWTGGLSCIDGGVVSCDDRQERALWLLFSLPHMDWACLHGTSAE